MGDTKKSSVNSEMFARILLSRVKLKDMFAMLKSQLEDDLPTSVNGGVISTFLQGLVLLKICNV